MEVCPRLPFSACSCLCRAAPGLRGGDAGQPCSWLVGHRGAFLPPLVERTLFSSWKWVLGWTLPVTRVLLGVLAALLTAIKIPTSVGIACLWR